MIEKEQREGSGDKERIEEEDRKERGRERKKEERKEGCRVECFPLGERRLVVHNLKELLALNLVRQFVGFED